MQMGVPCFSNSLCMSRDSSVNDGIRLSLQLPILGSKICLPFRPSAILWWRILGCEKGSEEVVSCCKLGGRQEANHARFDSGECQDALKHAEDSAGTVAIVKISCHRSATGTFPRIVVFPLTMKDMVIGAGTLITVGLPALQRPVVNLCCDTRR